jgi:hypothetical protein
MSHTKDPHNTFEACLLWLSLILMRTHTYRTILFVPYIRASERKCVMDVGLFETLTSFLFTARCLRMYVHRFSIGDATP